MTGEPGRPKTERGAHLRAHEYFTRVDAVSQTSIQGRLVFEGVEMDPGGVWVLTYGVAPGFRITIQAARDLELPSVARSGHFGFSYRPTERSGTVEAERESRVGFELCKILARNTPAMNPPAFPAATTAAKPEPRPQLNLGLMGRCDRGCRFCAWGAESPSSRLALRVQDTEAKFSAEKRRLKSLLVDTWKTTPNTCISWSGQDCFGSPNFDDLIRFAHRQGFRDMVVQGPGTRLADEDTVLFLVEHSVTEFNLTAHGHTPETFGESGGKEDAHALFWAAMGHLLEQDVHIAVEVPCYQGNVHELDSVLRDLEPHRVTYSVFFWYPHDVDRGLFSAMPLKFDAVMEQLARSAAWIPPGKISVSGIPPCAVPAALESVFCWDYPGNHKGSTTFAHTPECAPCPQRGSCPGFAEVYADQFG